MVRAAAIGGVVAAAAWWASGRLQAADENASKAPGAALGRELFEREWLPGDSRAHGGDGLGPVYNDSSCIACHNLGGSGGAGPVSKNVDIITASPNSNMVGQSSNGASAKPGFLGRALGSLVGLDESDTVRKGGRTPTTPRLDTTELVKAHPGFRTARSVVLHRFGVEADYESWRQKMAGFNNGMPSNGTTTPTAMTEAQVALNQSGVRTMMQNNIGPFTLVGSQRNPSPLFGAGLIDAIPDRVLEDAAKVKHPNFPEVKGRVSRLKDRRIGRFGWKGQTPSLHDFVLTACAVELGLEVPGHHQGGIPKKPEARARGLDLTAGECDALEKYVREIPRPAERRPATPAEASDLDAGRALFASVGCATCHTPKLGQVEGIYSDLLLHDMGRQLGDTGQYSVFDPSASEEDFVDPDTSPDAPPAEGPDKDDEASEVVLAPPSNCPTTDLASAGKRPEKGLASRFEWRTPPLWGFRDSGPYLHDGRAVNLDQAVSQHGGESKKIAETYFRLSLKERRQIEAFLKSLTAPVEDAGRIAAAR